MRYKLKAYFCRFGLTEMLNRFLDEGVSANIEVRRCNKQEIRHLNLQFEADIETDDTKFYLSVRNVYSDIDEIKLNLCRSMI